MKYKLIEQVTIYQGNAFGVSQDWVQLPDGREFQVDVVVHPPAVVLVPLDENGFLWFIQQYRHPVEQIMLELPAGMMEPGETPPISAQRELREEIGMAARSLEPIGEFYLAPGYSTERLHIFLARNLYPSPLEGDIDEFLSISKMPFEHAFRLAESGQFRDAKTLAALTLARKHVKG